MARFPISSWKNNKEILRMFYVTETDSNIHLLKAIKSVWNPIETPPHFSEAHTYKKKLIESNWRNGLAWLVEERFKIFTKNDHLFAKTLHKDLQTWGLLLNAELELCEGCFDRVSHEVFSYTSGVEWWQATLLERKQHSISNISEEPLEDQKNSKKRGLVSEHMRKPLALMRCGENPFHPHDPDFQHNYKLIKAAIGIGKGHPLDHENLKREREEFREKYWRQYLRAYQNWINCCHNSKALKYCRVIGSKDEAYKVVAQINGPQTITLFPINAKPILTNRGKYKR